MSLFVTIYFIDLLLLFIAKYLKKRKRKLRINKDAYQQPLDDATMGKFICD